MSKQSVKKSYSPGPDADYRSACPLCGHSEIKKVYNQPDSFLCKCSNCKLVFACAIPTNQELNDFYSDYPRYDTASEMIIQNYNYILDKLEKYRKTNRLIEIGCGEGFFLEQARKRNWEVYGTELSPEALDICARKKLNVKNSVDNFGFDKTEAFDVIISIEVIEHLPYPLKEATLYENLLRKGGALYMTTPNFNSISRRVLSEKWSIILYPEHLIYYTPSTITKLFEKFGFKKIRVQTEGISPARFIYSYKKNNVSQKAEADNYNFNEVDRNLRNRIEKNKLLSLSKTAINYILSTAGVGDSMKVLFEKN